MKNGLFVLFVVVLTGFALPSVAELESRQIPDEWMLSHSSYSEPEGLDHRMAYGPMIEPGGLEVNQPIREETSRPT